VGILNPEADIAFTLGSFRKQERVNGIYGGAEVVGGVAFDY
jgi:hypothetical protein